MSTLKYNKLKDSLSEEYIRITKNRITCGLRCFKSFSDGYFTIIIPSVMVSGYGKNEKEADEMLSESMKSYFEYLIDLPVKRQLLELNKMGWSQRKLKRKEYSKAYVDRDGFLKNYDIDPSVNLEESNKQFALAV